MPPYHPKDVKSSKWTPFEPMIHVFTPIKSEWKPKDRSWVLNDEKERKARLELLESHLPPLVYKRRDFKGFIEKEKNKKN